MVGIANSLMKMATQRPSRGLLAKVGIGTGLAAGAGMALAQTPDEAAEMRDRIRALEVKRDEVLALRGLEKQKRLLEEGYTLGEYGADGEVGDATSAAVSQFTSDMDERIAREREALDSIMTEVVAKEGSAPGWVEMLREVGPYAAGVLGIGLGVRGRVSAAKKFAKEAEQKIAEANAALQKNAIKDVIPSGDIKTLIDRAAAVNQFWRAGGAGANQGPFSINGGKLTLRGGKGVMDEADLFPVGSQMRGMDKAAIWGGGIEGTVGLGAAGLQMLEVEAAKKEVEDNPTSAAARARLERANTMMAIILGASRFGHGAALGRAVSIGKNPYTLGKVAPALQSAQKQRALVSDYLLRRKAGLVP
jgi:hypothetical protein